MLGPFELRDGDRPLPDAGPRVRALLARLALEPGRVVSTEVLISDLWGSDQPSGTLNALQSLVSRARRTLTGVPDVVLRSHGSGYVLDVAAEDVDTHAFEWAVVRGRELLDDQRNEEAAATLRRALESWRGEPLGDVDAPFAEPQVARLDELRLTATEARVEADLRLGGHAEVVAELDALTARHPLRERFTTLRMRALYATDRQADALEAYEALRQRLAEELGVDPSPESQSTHLAVLRADPALVGTRPAARPEVRGLPVRVSSFVGRESEIGTVRDGLASSRLVTLFGPGGAGKTRLAGEIAASIEGRRVVFVELAAVRDDADVAAAVTGAVGVRDTRMFDAPGDRLAELLATTPTLLVMDNCEHVVDAAATFVARLLATTVDVRVLATSREPLAIDGEVLLPIGPLSVPERDVPVRESEAVQLFADRARAARPGFDLDEDTTADVVEICRRLDGMPLAIELAAARLRGMTVRQVAERLDDRFRLLTTGHRTAMPRHRTLRAVVEWSWGLLSEDERVLARRMSVFTGPVSAETVAAVCGDPNGPDVLYVLASLVEKSLVQTVESTEDIRYRMLETVRAFCSSLLAETGEQEDVRRAHAEHFLVFAEHAAPRLHESDQLTWLDRLDAEHDNIMTAVHWTIEVGDADRGVRLGAALAWYWSTAGRIAELGDRLGQVAAIPGEAPPESRAALELMRACFGTSVDWHEPVRRGVAASAESRAMDRYLYLAVMEPMAASVVTEDQTQDSVRRAREHPHPWSRAAAMFADGIDAQHRVDLVEHEKRMAEAAERFRVLGERWGLAHTAGGLALSRSVRGDVAGAVEVLAEATEAMRQLRSTDDIVSMLVRSGMELTRLGDLRQAREALDEARELGTSVPHHEVLVDSALAEAERVDGNLRAAAEHLAVARRTAADCSFAREQLWFVVRSFETRLHLTTGEHDRARDTLRDCAHETERTAQAMTADLLGRWFVASGDHDTAAYALGLTVALRGMLDHGDPDVGPLLTEIDTALTPAVAEYRRAAGEALTAEDAWRETQRLLG